MATSEELLPQIRKRDPDMPYVKRSAMSKQALYNRHYAYKQDIDQQMRKYHAPPKELVDKMKRSREITRPISLDDKQLNVLNSESYRRMIRHYEQLRIVEQKSTESVKNLDAQSLTQLDKLQKRHSEIRSSIKGQKFAFCDYFRIEVAVMIGLQGWNIPRQYEACWSNARRSTVGWWQRAKTCHVLRCWRS